MAELNIYDAIIIGAGPAGLFSAINIYRGKPSRILILEKMHAAGRKLLLSGSGSCNITHSGSMKDFEKKYGTNGRFLRYALSGFSNTDMVRLLNSNGINTIETDNGKIFPESMKAGEILSLLLNLCREAGIEILYSHPVSGICYTDKYRIMAAGTEYTSRYCVISTGGSSYPGTGSSGDGYKLAESLGHRIMPVTPALAPVSALAPECIFSDMAGIAIKNTTVHIIRNNKKIASQTGDLLFTHTGLSGPVILDLSRYIAPGDILKLSFVQRSSESIEEELIVLTRSEGKRNVKNLVRMLGLPERLVHLILRRLSVAPEKKGSEISRDERKRIIELITSFPVTVEAKGDFSIAMATHGGVSVEEINPRTMESKIIPGLFFAGEVIDIDGDTGGYNLQAAFSTGRLAGETTGKRIHNETIPD